MAAKEGTKHGMNKSCEVIAVIEKGILLKIFE
jgi:hypothetical protein